MAAPIGWLAAVAVALTVGFLAGRAALDPPDVDLAGGEPASVAVVEASVGRDLPVNVQANWARKDLGVVAAAGTLTSIEVEPGATVRPGDVVLTVDLRPVVAAEGAIPSFRDLIPGASGKDVAQLQKLLVAVGHLGKGQYTASRFDARTTAAVRAWQRTTGLPADGIVRAGDIVYAEKLPARVVQAESVDVGDRVEPGTVVLAALGASPTLRASQVPETPFAIGETIDVDVDGEWRPAIIESIAPDPEAPTHAWAVLTAADGTLCSDGCGLTPGSDGGSLRGRKVIVPAATGPSIPQSALATTGAGGHYVVDMTGARRDVKVLAHGDGRVVVEGLQVGDVVRLPDEATS